MDLSADMPVTLVIKAPNQRLEDQTVDCMIGWTIKKLKRHLESVYPSKPKHNEQRLIYYGKLLQDDLTLKDILRKNDSNDMPSRHTVHLVCSKNHEISTFVPLTSQGPKSPIASTKPKAPPTTVSSPNSSATPQTSELQSFTNDRVRYRGQGYVPVTSGFTQYFPSYPMHGQIPEGSGHQYSPEQYTWMMQQQQQQMYSQYMMQYMQYYQGMYGVNPGFVSSQLPTYMAHVNATSQPTPPAGPTAQPAQEQQRPAPVADNNAARPNMRMNAQGGMDEDVEDEGDPRDWLHHTYFLMRFLTFLGILFFYSSFSRFILVLGGSFALFLFQKLRKYVKRNQRLQEQLQQQQQQEQEQQQQQSERQNIENAAGQENQEEHQRETEANARTEADNPAPVQENEQDTETIEEAPAVVGEGNRLMRLLLFTCNTIQAFFTSLVPAPPELLEAN